MRMFLYIIDTNGILDINKHLMKIAIIQNRMFGFINKMFIGLLAACTIGNVKLDQH